MIMSKNMLMEVFVPNFIFLIRRMFDETSTQVVFSEKCRANMSEILDCYGDENWENTQKKPATE